ncbi:F0F1 ATP synthase subunit delta [Alphaproteobacteria bacterium]|nr:F0F1 ATP synthase subunit delta [Alphaproteobacteria bacterium]
MSAGLKLESKISERYVGALFELAAERGAVDRVGNDLAQLSRMMKENDLFRSVVETPILDREKQVNAMTALTERAGMDVLSRNFVSLLASNRRLHALSEMITAYDLMVSSSKGEINVEITSVLPLSEKQNSNLKKKIEKALGADIVLETQIDETLIGGLVIKIGSRMIDNSISTKLQNLKVAMKGAS